MLAGIKGYNRMKEGDLIGTRKMHSRQEEGKEMGQEDIWQI